MNFVHEPGDDQHRGLGRPWLAPWDTAELVQMGPEGDGTGWGGIDPAEVRYGTTLPELAQRYCFLGDLLEAAAVAGHTSAIFEGLVMTVRAYHASLLATARTDEIEGVDGDALAALDATTYRLLIMVLEDHVVDLESRAADLHRKLLAHGRPRLEGAKQGSALDCEARAGRARQRAVMAREDNERAMASPAGGATQC